MKSGCHVLVSIPTYNKERATQSKENGRASPEDRLPNTYEYRAIPFQRWMLSQLYAQVLSNEAENMITCNSICVWESHQLGRVIFDCRIFSFAVALCSYFYSTIGAGDSTCFRFSISSLY